MRLKIESTGFSSVVTSFKDLARSRAGKEWIDLEIGYSAPYAIHVHEDLSMPHVVGQAKFVEQPFRIYELSIISMIVNMMRRKVSLREAMIKAGNFLYDKTQELVPIDTGVLKASGFIELKERNI